MPGPVLAALLMSSSASLLAQAPSRGIDCSKAKDPKACEERLAKGKAAYPARCEARAKQRQKSPKQ